MITEKQLQMLSPRSSRILRMKHGIGSNTKHSLSEIGLQFALSENEVKKIVDAAERKIQN